MAKKATKNPAKKIDLRKKAREEYGLNNPDHVFYTALPISNETSNIYFLTCGRTVEKQEFVKIGHTKDIKHRFQILQVGNPQQVFIYYHFAVFQRMVETTEKMLHAVFNDYHYRGEWFYFNDIIKDWVAKHFKHNIYVVVHYPIIKAMIMEKLKTESDCND